MKQNFIIRNIPNTITCLNLFSGCIACVMAFRGDYQWAAYFIYIAAVFDFFDGFAARLLHAYSAMGKELDSLADCVSFGVAPGLIMFSLLGDVVFPDYLQPYAEYVPYFAFIIPVFSMLRLAKFNLDERQTSSFIGLPTPANSIFMASISCYLPAFMHEHGIWLIGVTVAFSALLVVPLPMFSLKMKNLKLKHNTRRYIFFVLSALLLIVVGIDHLYLVIILYIVMSLIMAVMPKKQRNC
ncbi:CDP-diacylglycerol--serine O-phosphatidyltransferase [Bacteroidia bacterium]|nr:CDP-diacylglycerol--serine O-phosphatidyltransferase [Bacteroidia bacterium]